MMHEEQQPSAAQIRRQLERLEQELKRLTAAAGPAGREAGGRIDNLRRKRDALMNALSEFEKSDNWKQITSGLKDSWSAFKKTVGEAKSEFEKGYHGESESRERQKPSRRFYPRSLALLTDLYQLTMAAAYYEHGMTQPATFSLFIRDYPPGRAFFVAAGLEDVLRYLETFRFIPEDIEYLRSLDLFSEAFLEFLGSLRFTGTVFAMPEGRIFFKDEPVLEVTAPIIEAQLVETLIINTINLNVSIATKAARCVHAARGRGLVDFSLRRTQGADAGLKVARAAYIAGFSGTSNVLAGKWYDIPVSGTMAHSFVTSFEKEREAFRAFAKTFPQNAVLLIDTYDTLLGARKAAEIAREMAAEGRHLRGVRLDSGDMAELSRQVREIFRQEGVEDLRIFASGGFDEYKISDVLDRGAEIDAFGVGTKMGVSADAPYTDMAYKLVQYAGRPVLKLSSGKRTLVSEKQVFRILRDNRFARDIIALRHEPINGASLLEPRMSEGKSLKEPEGLSKIRKRFQGDFAALDSSFKALHDPPAYPVELGSQLAELQEQVIHEVIEKELGES